MEPGANFVSGEKATRKYLAGHAEPETEWAERLGARFPAFGHGVAIPCYAEGSRISECLATIPPGPRGPVLTVVVVNAPAGAAAAARAANQRSLAQITRDYGEAEKLSPTASAFKHPAGTLLVVDRSSSQPLPERQGVGLARKIGADLLLALGEQGRLISPWIHCTDADATLPADYFEQVEGAGRTGTAALLYRFRHLAEGDPLALEAALQYEISLRYYVMALRFASSPHAFHSIGSTLAVHALAYAQVRGFPRREAAEDFHLLNKLAKVGAIEPLAGTPLGLSCRTSFRVPFGTGAAIGRFLETGESSIRTYDPRIFHHLRAWQRVLGGVISNPAAGKDLRDLAAAQAVEDAVVDADLFLGALESSGVLLRAHEDLGAPGKAAHKRLMDGFDGLRTLQFVHSLRDAGMGNLPLRAALEKASFLEISGDEARMSSEALARRVEALEYASEKNPPITPPAILHSA